MQTQIVEHVKNRHGNRIGTVVATRVGNDILLGWSKCKTRLDKFDPKRGVQIAMGRAVMGSHIPVASSLQFAYDAMKERASRYFKGATIKRCGREEEFEQVGACRPDGL
jgi:hypothetical protein